MARVLESRRRYVFDIEANGLLEESTVIHCLTIKDIDTGGIFHYPPDKIKVGLMRLYCAKVLVCHNLIGFDLPLIRKFFPKWDTKAQVYDTMILSQMFWPDIGKHNLDVWGERLGIAKPVHEDWSVYSDEMRIRCNEDVKINFLLWQKCQKEMMKWDWKESIQLEQDVARIHAKQVHYGIAFDMRKALRLYGRLHKEMELIDFKIKKDMPFCCKKLNSGKAITTIFLKAGGYQSHVKKYFDGDMPNVRGPYSKIHFPRVGANETAELKKYFLRNGWVPDEYNWKKVDGKMIRMSPKLTLESLETSNITSKIGKDIIHRMMLSHRRNIISTDTGKGLLPHVREDGRIPSDAHTCGTPTARYRHMVVCNIPRPSTPYGNEVRELFGVTPGRVQVGIDLAGIEARLMAHYCYVFTGGKQLAYEITDGDFHSKNANLWAVIRDLAKSGLYCLMYGGGAGKLASTLKKPSQLGGRLRDAFWDGNYALKELKEAVEAVIKKNGGWIKGLDGRKIYIRAAYKSLNSLFQCGAAVVFKRWLVMMDEWIVQEYVDAHQMIAYHDEGQFECSKKDATGFANHAACLAQEAGEYYSLNVATPADPIEGYNWRDCH